MSRLYGQLQGSRGRATRCGQTSIEASVQSYEGSVITELTFKDSTTPMIRVSIAEGSSFYGRTCFYGTIDELKEKLGGK